ncbi:MAG: hypothetical protein GKR89_33180 [Candidatus Latescibacteria bacterium]|nr:hypothetical protein [Candidatus Latescibacterota bacterium]
MRLSVGRIPIRIKIFALSITMLVLLVCTSAITYYQVGGVTHELADIAHYQMPLEHQAAEIGAVLLEQEIHVERVFDRPGPHRHSDDFLAAEQRRFKAWEAVLRAEVDTARKLVEASLEHATTKEDIVDFAQVEAKLGQIEQEHRQYHEHALRIFAQQQKGDTAGARLLRAQLHREEEDIGREIDALLAQLEKLAVRSAATASRHERQALQTSLVLVRVAVATGLAWAIFMAIRITRPLDTLLQSTQDVRQGGLDVQVEVASRVDKFIGDGIAAFWGPPFAGPDEHARLACEAALEQFVQLEKMDRRLSQLLGLRRGLPTLNIRVGLATGSLLAGDIGSDQY